ncbi:hypothetical protein EBZ35_07625, partial [bacterium]|nr:hypothetical protein [bacterium]
IVLDGEWIRTTRKGETISHYYAFDILAGRRGDVGVMSLPLITPDPQQESRYVAMTTIVSDLNTYAQQTVKDIPPAHDLYIGVKHFVACLPGDDIFVKGAASVLDSSKTALYNTDGLIFTPNASPLPPPGKGSWTKQLKWKPSHENTIDFLVLEEKDKGTGSIQTKYRQDTGQMVQYKTLRLFVGSDKVQAFVNPRETVLKGLPLPATTKAETGEWREVEFRPTEPSDPMASVCYVELTPGIGDSEIRAKSGDVLQSQMIVEMAYYPERDPGWRWEPMRVRHDKTELWQSQRQQQQQQQGKGPGQRRGGRTMNADWVADSIWHSIHNPITEETIRTGSGSVSVSGEPTTQILRTGKTRNSALLVQMTRFHDAVRQFVWSLVAPVTVCDLAVQNGTDIHKWSSPPTQFVFGCDASADAINSPTDGAYRRLLNRMVESTNQVPKMLFAVADVTRSLKRGEAGKDAEDNAVIAQVFSDPSRSSFDVVSCLFSLQTILKDETALFGFLENVSDCLKVGGYFIGCLRDGDAVFRLLSDGEGRETDTWSISRNGEIKSQQEFQSYDLNFYTAGEKRTEYIVSWTHLYSRLQEIGLKVLTPDEMAEISLPATVGSTPMFSELWSYFVTTRRTFEMPPSIKQLSFMNRLFICKRHANKRPIQKVPEPQPTQPQPTQPQ